MAGIWSGTSDSWVSLARADFTSSTVNGVFDGLQAGSIITDGSTGNWRASFWSGTAESWVNLHDFLPSHYSRSEALSIWRHDGRIHIGGTARNSITGREEAHVWTFEQPLTLIPLPTGAGLAFAGLGVLAIRRRTRG
jgi:hypothetical protein